ncbi:MAG: polymorphic toxin-type HINT domain-containing protein [Nostoc sp.]|uniref:polymorphic toxin-type HINT domain-containing protein n=1 Tax=Nostoc sp. TaxID=1180 RepID=UPI002FEF704A
MGAIIGGALAAGVFDTARQGYQLIDSAIHGDGRKTDFDVDELLQSVQIGAALGPLLAVVPEAALYFAYEGIKSGVAELEAGNIATGVFDILTSVIPLVEQAGSKGGSNCFVAGTKILTTEGEKNIEDIQVGDWVIADDPNTPGEIEAHQVLDTFVRETSALVDLYVDGEVISTTGEHPFWTPDKGWVEAKDLQVGSLLQTEDGRVIDVDRVEKQEGQFKVYNFNVEGFHTYFVSDLGILVHNTCGGSPISFDEAIERAQQFLEPGVPMRVMDGPTGIQIIQEFTDSAGRRITRRVGFDVNPSSGHVRQLGSHLNLQTQINGVIQRGALTDPHIPIDPSTVRTTNY